MSCIDAAIIKALAEHVDNNNTPSVPTVPSENKSVQDLSPITNVGWSSKILADSYTSYLTLRDDNLNSENARFVLQTINGYELYAPESIDATTLTYKNFINDTRITFTKNANNGLWETSDVNSTMSTLPNNSTTGALQRKPIYSLGSTLGEPILETDNVIWEKLVFIMPLGLSDYGFFTYHGLKVDGLADGTSTALRGVYIDLFNPNRAIKVSYTTMLRRGNIYLYNKIGTAEWEQELFSNRLKTDPLVGSFYMMESEWSHYQKADNSTNYLIAKINEPIVPTTVFRYIKENIVLEYVCIAANEDEITFIDSSNKQIKFEYVPEEAVWKLQVGDHIYVPDSIKTGFFSPQSLLWAYIKHLHQLE